MTYIVCEPCIKCKFTDCVAVCPVDAFREGVNFLVIDPDTCIDCDLCRETAEDNFKRDEDGGYSFVYKQPENEDEAALCLEAMEACPVEAIGSDGEDD